MGIQNLAPATAGATTGNPQPPLPPAGSAAVGTGAATLPSSGNDAGAHASIAWLPAPLQEELCRFLSLRDTNALARTAKQFRGLAATTHAPVRARGTANAGEIAELALQSRRAPPATRVEVVRTLIDKANSLPAGARDAAIAALASAVSTFSKAQMQALLAAVGTNGLLAGGWQATLRGLFQSEGSVSTLLALAGDRTADPCQGWSALRLAAPGIATARRQARDELAGRAAVVMWERSEFPRPIFHPTFDQIEEATYQAYSELSDRLDAQQRGQPWPFSEEQGMLPASTLLRQTIAVGRQRRNFQRKVAETL
ncbi:hypothetical protein [Cupriavidus sp. AU9028]|uniref:hypothetical protein n=1 Tax=Cupriavidus sp. AU9028 TaxID=2871157 RepID=UPI001C97E572|nr:hypothetical protein [Cupriavidus sp. AU9028]MBY4895618.1 hypothetical protein [Cupriavidus sp. AU9028]